MNMVNCSQGGTSDERLMSAYQGGDYTAFEELYLRYSGKIYAFLACRLPEPVARRRFPGDISKIS